MKKQPQLEPERRIHPLALSAIIAPKRSPLLPSSGISARKGTAAPDLQNVSAQFKDLVSSVLRHGKFAEDEEEKTPEMEICDSGDEELPSAEGERNIIEKLGLGVPEEEVLACEVKVE